MVYLTTLVDAGGFPTNLFQFETLSVTEFSGEQPMPKVYENGHESVLSIWCYLVSNVKI